MIYEAIAGFNGMINNYLQRNQCQGESQRTAVLFDVRVKFRALMFAFLSFGLFHLV